MDLGTSYCFDDILMEPLLSTISTRSSISLETDIGTNDRHLILKTPLISSPMDTVTETEMAIKMALNGGLGIIHRYMDIDTQVGQVTKVKRFLQYIISEPYTISPEASLYDIEELRDVYNVSSFCVVDKVTNIFIGMVTRRDIEYMKHMNTTSQITNTPVTSPLKVVDFINKNNVIKLDTDLSLENMLNDAKYLMLKNKIEKIPIVKDNILSGLITLKNIRHYEDNKYKACSDANGALCVGASIGIVGDYLERLARLVAAGADLICVDVANGFNTNVFAAIKLIRSQYPNLVLMVGNVCNWQGYAALAELDVDCIRVGIGNGSICTTRLDTGIGKGQFSAVSECFKYKCLIEVKGDMSPMSPTHPMPPMPNIICDGGSLGKTGNKVKALATGACAIMLGRTLSSTEESPGSIIYRNGKRFKYIRGMASTMANLSKQEKSGGVKINSNSSSSSNTNKKIHSEGVDGEQELSGSVLDVIDQINGGLKSGMSYLGCENIKQLHNKNSKGEIKFNLVTSIGMSESGIRIKAY